MKNVRYRSPGHRAAACDGKRGFLTFALATAVCKERSRGRNSRRRDVYRCHCGMYHLGTPPKFKPCKPRTDDLDFDY